MQTNEKILNQCEREVAREYCLNHELTRPRTNMKTFVAWVLFIEAISIICSYMLYKLFHWFSISFPFNVLYFLLSAVFFLVFLKKICVLFVQLYQHYASEKTRRKCVMMPSCSEYALLALEKYNVFKGLYKTYIRMTTKCKGNYKIDYP